MDDLIEQITPYMAKQEYFRLLLEHSDVIYEYINFHGKVNTAKVLNMSPQAFSTFFPIMNAHKSIMHSLQEDKHDSKD